MAAIRPKNTFGVVGERSLLPIDPAELAATEKRGAVDILAIEFWISWVSNNISEHNNQPSLVEWTAFDQKIHLVLWASGPFSV
jgi:hypothetical protein